MDLKDKIYLDNAATTPMLEEVVYEMIPFMRIAYGNPSSTHSFGREGKAAIELSRKKIAKILHCNPSEIIFTSSGTEANNLAIYIAVHALECKTIITSKTEHNAVLNSVRSYSNKINIEFVNLDSKGNVDLDHLEELLEKHPHSFISLMSANNEIGTLLDSQKVEDLAAKYEAYFHSDSVQSLGHFPFDLSKNKNLHLITGSAHKFHGPKGVGFLYIKKGTKVTSQLKGGPQERETRAGTENVAAIVGLAKSLEIAYKELEDRQKYISDLKLHLQTQLLANFPELKINGETGEKSLYSILNVSFPPHKSRDMLPFALDLKGIAVSAGSACSSGSTEFSHVLKAIGSRDDWPAIRISLSHLNTNAEIDRFIISLKEVFSK